MTKVRIYKPTRTAMQQGEAKTRRWALEFEPQSPQNPEPLMGWTSSANTRTQVRLRFDTLEQAVDYAKRHGLDYRIFEPQPKKVRIKSYADNFRFDQVR